MPSQVARLSKHVIAVCISFAAIGCGGGNSGGGTTNSGNSTTTPPAISNFSFSPNSVTQSAGGMANVSGTVSFTDASGTLATFTVTIFDAGGQQLSAVTSPVQGVAGLKSGTLAGAFTVSTSAAGTFTFHISVADSSGSKSNELTGAFQIIAASGLATVVSATGPSPASLTLANGSLYWSESGDAAVKSVPVSGGTASVLATKMVNPVSVAFNGTDAIWVDDEPSPTGTCGTPSTARVLKRTTSTGITTVLAKGNNCAPFTGNSVVIDANTAFWISSTLSPNTYVINATPLSGGTTTAVYSTTAEPIVALALNPGTLYWMENFYPMASGAIRSVPTTGGSNTTIVSGFVSDANTFAVDSTAVYYATPNFPPTNPPETLLAAPLGGGSANTLSSAATTPVKLAVGGGKVVWIDSSSVNAIPVGGGSIAVLASASTDTPIDVLVDGVNAVWTESTGAVHGETGSIDSVPLTGGAANTLYQGGDAPRVLVIDPASQINWIEGGPVGLAEGFARIARITSTNVIQTVVSGVSSDSATLVSTATDLLIADRSRIKRLPLSGGVPVTVAADDASDGPIARLATDGSFVYWDTALHGSIRKAPVAGGSVTVLISVGALGALGGVGGPIRVALNGNLYWANQTKLLSIPSGSISTSANLINQALGPISDLAVDASNVYFSEPSTGAVLGVPGIGGGLTTLANAGFPLSNISLELDGSTLYWLDPNKIVRLPAAGGTTTEVVVLSPALSPTESFAVDASNVYWIEPATFDIRKAPK